ASTLHMNVDEVLARHEGKALDRADDGPFFARRIYRHVQRPILQERDRATLHVVHPDADLELRNRSIRSVPVAQLEHDVVTQTYGISRATRRRIYRDPFKSDALISLPILSAVQAFGRCARIGQMRGYSCVWGAWGFHPPRLHQQDPAAKRLDCRHIMTDQQYGAIPSGYFRHFAEAFLLKIGVTDGQHFIDDQYAGIEMGGDSECKPHIHAGGISLHRRVEEFFYAGKIDDLLEFRIDLFSGHPENGAVEINVLASGQLGVKAGTDFQQTADAAADFDATFGRTCD